MPTAAVFYCCQVGCVSVIALFRELINWQKNKKKKENCISHWSCLFILPLAQCVQVTNEFCFTASSDHKSKLPDIKLTFVYKFRQWYCEHTRPIHVCTYKEFHLISDPRKLGLNVIL